MGGHCLAIYLKEQVYVGIKVVYYTARLLVLDSLSFNSHLVSLND